MLSNALRGILRPITARTERSGSRLHHAHRKLSIPPDPDEHSLPGNESQMISNLIAPACLIDRCYQTFVLAILIRDNSLIIFIHAIDMIGGESGFSLGDGSADRYLWYAPIVIIRIGCRFPIGIEGPHDFWTLIASDTGGIIDIRLDRLARRYIFGTNPGTPGQMGVRHSGRTAVNQDRRTPDITAASGKIQRTVRRQACRPGDIEPASVGYYEPHGTGFPPDESIEAAVIGDVLQSSDRTHWIGPPKPTLMPSGRCTQSCVIRSLQRAAGSSPSSSPGPNSRPARLSPAPALGRPRARSRSRTPMAGLPLTRRESFG